MANHLTTSFFGLADHKGFVEGIQKAINSISGGGGYLHRRQSIYL